MVLLIERVYQLLVQAGFRKETLDLLSVQNLFKLAEEYDYKIIVNEGTK